MLLLDEPSSMVDPATEQKLIARLKALQGTTILLATHRMAMLALVDRLIVMDRGRIVADGPRDDVLKALMSQRAAEEVGARPASNQVGTAANSPSNASASPPGQGSGQGSVQGTAPGMSSTLSSANPRAAGGAR